MSPLLYEKLRTKYPLFLKDIKYTGVGDGWVSIIDNALADIQCMPVDENFRLQQIKEKFGKLCIYYHPYSPNVQCIIDNAGKLSLHVCEVCGHAGTRRTDRSWLKTLCDYHASLDKQSSML